MEHPKNIAMALKGRRAADVRYGASKVTLPCAPFDIAPSNRDESRPYDRRSVHYKPADDRPMPRGAALIAMVKSEIRGYSAW